MVERERHIRNFFNSKRGPVIPLAALMALGAVGVVVSAGEISKFIATYRADNMLGQLGLSRKIPIADGLHSSKDGTEIFFGLDLPQKDGTSHHVTVIFSRDSAVKTAGGNSKDNPAVKITANNVIRSKSLSFFPPSLPYSEVIDMKTSNKVRLEGNVEVFLPRGKTLDNSAK